MTAEIEARGVIAVHRSRGSTVAALRGLDLRVGSGEIAAVVGPSGSGKTTLLRLLAGSDRPTAGSLVVHGLALEAADDRALRGHRRSVVGVVDQHYRRALSPFLPAAEIVALPLAVRGVDQGTRRRRVAELLEAIGLGGRGDARLAELSGGEQQRLAVAAALAIRPPILLADEPTGELDAASTAELLRILGAAIRSQGATAVIVTHDPAVEAIADRVVVLEDGRAVAVREGPAGSPERQVEDSAGWRAPAVTWRNRRVDAPAAAVAEPPASLASFPRDAVAGPAIRIRDLSRRYGTHGHELIALDRVTADVATHGVHVITGPSGSGKSTLLRIVAGLDRPDSGTVEVLGTDLASLDREGLAAFRATTIGVAEQARGLIRFLSVRENVRLAASLHGGARRSEADPAALDGLLELLGIAGQADRRPDELSAGERTRAAIARVLVTGPAILALDEPTATLDRVSAARIAGLLGRLGRDRTVLVATHDPALVGIAHARLDLARAAR